MKKLAFSFLIFLLGCSQSPETKQKAASSELPAAPELICKEIRNADENPDSPLSEVYVKLGDYQLKVADVTICLPLEKSDFASQNIPDSALSAVTGWWAGAGDYFYLVADGEYYRIMYKGEDEAQEAPSDFEAIMVLSKDGKIVEQE